MTAELAQAIFFMIWGAALVFWVWGLKQSLRLLRRAGTTSEFLIAPRDEDEPTEPGVVRGEAEVEGPSAALLEELVRRLPRALGSTFALHTTADGLELRNALRPVFSRVGWENVTEVRLTVARADFGRTRVSYELDLGPLSRWLGRIALLLVVGVGLPVLLLVGGLIWWLAVPSTVPAVRWQVFQTFQIVHGLWPPFMVTSRLGANVARAQASLHAVIETAGDAVSG